MIPQLDKKLRIRISFIKLFDILYCMPKWRKFHKILTKTASTSNNFFFIQVGANDGVIYDPLHRYIKKYNWSGILVEPISCYFNKLKKNYEKNPNLNFENIAVSDKEEVRDFYRIKEGIDYFPKWCEGLGTFYLEVLLTHKWAIPNIRDYVIKEKVNCISFNSLLKRYSVKTIDLLSIDTEGYDYEIIKQIDFNKIKPKIIIYEHKHINKKDRKDCNRLLKNHNYLLAKHFGSTLAYLPN